MCQQVCAQTAPPLASSYGDADYFEEQDDPESEDDMFAEFEWLEQMDGIIEMTSPANPEKPLRVGYCDAKLIMRNRVQSFYSDLEQPTRRLACLLLACSTDMVG